ncbi:putative inorganic phosphate cotransporter [Bactrocera neohumeralis]|uniref:putative inorganic phosphate cotransporter n=1 Tax=Bactrocera neohumeralis TaxID=98809 RepID=UPI00216645C7|nr:putative inorganic phosphate cotransporter [Bactrocera neohumeralis]
MVLDQRYSIEPSSQFKGKIFGYRHLQCLLIFMGFLLVFATRVNLSIAIVAMMDNKAANPDFPEYAWSEQTKSHILSSFFCGFILLQIPGGAWARHLGGHILMLVSIGVSSVLALLTPLSVSIGGWPLLCALRFTQGLLQGVILPSVATILAKWAPVEERSAMQTFIYSGSQLGIVLMLATSGNLCLSRWGWPSTFYLPGALGLIWSVLWYIFGASTPRDCKHISVEERNMIENSLGHDKKAGKKIDEKHPVPWKRIFTSKPFLVTLVNSCANDWCFWTLLTQIPSYIKSVLGKDINSNALISALPYMSMFTLSMILCPVGTWLEKSKRLNPTVSRKIFNTIGLWGPAIALICLGYLRQDQGDLAIGLLTATITFSTHVNFGHAVNHLDLAPNLAGTLLGIANCGSNMTGIIAPLVVGYVVTEATNIHQWRIIFFLSAGITFVGNLFFLIFATAKVQHWNEPPREVTPIEQLEQLVDGLGEPQNAAEEPEDGDGDVKKIDVEQSTV